MEDLAGKGAVITGGASGIGLATAWELALRGVRLVLADMDERALDDAVAALRAAGHEAYGVRCDVRHLDAVERLADESFGALGAVHIVFNNAGVAAFGPVTEMTHDDWRWIIDVDLWGPIHGAEVFVPRLVEQGEGGHVLFTASFAGLVPNIGLGPYCVAKYGVVALAEVLQRELKAHDIGVSVLCPMRVVTNIDRSDAHRQSDYGGPQRGAEVRAPSDANQRADEAHERSDANQRADEAREPSDANQLAGGVMPVEEVARKTVEAIVSNELYVLPHAESREAIRRRFQRIDAAFDRA